MAAAVLVAPHRHGGRRGRGRSLRHPDAPDNGAPEPLMGAIRWSREGGEEWRDTPCSAGVGYAVEREQEHDSEEEGRQPTGDGGAMKRGVASACQPGAASSGHGSGRFGWSCYCNVWLPARASAAATAPSHGLVDETGDRAAWSRASPLTPSLKQTWSHPFHSTARGQDSFAFTIVGVCCTIE